MKKTRLLPACLVRDITIFKGFDWKVNLVPVASTEHSPSAIHKTK